MRTLSTPPRTPTTDTMPHFDVPVLDRSVQYEEFVNWTTHAFGCVLAIAVAGPVLMWAALHGTAASFVGCCVYLASLVLLYALSTAYHFADTAKIKDFFHIMDRCGIYLLIAGTYMPFTLGPLYGTFGWTVSGIVWSITAVGITKELLLPFRYRWVAIVLYLTQGWLGLFAFPALSGRLPGEGIMWLLFGGIAYTLGVVFFSWEKLPYNHAVWHLFVLVGSAAHLLAVLSAFGFCIGVLA